MQATAKALGLEGAQDAPAQLVEETLPSGLRVTWTMPDLFAVLSFTGTVPDPVTASVIKLLMGEGSYVPEDDPRSWHHKAEHIKGQYGIVAAGLVSPKLDLAREWGDGAGTLGRRDLSWADVQYCFHVLFRIGDRGARRPVADPADAQGPESPTPAGDELPPTPK